MEVTRLCHLAGGVQVAARWLPFQTLDSLTPTKSYSRDSSEKIRNLR